MAEAFSGIGRFFNAAPVSGVAGAAAHSVATAANYLPNATQATTAGSGLSGQVQFFSDIFSPIAGAFGQYQEARARADLMDANADYARQRANDLRVASSRELAANNRRRRAIIAEQAAQLSDRGASSGTALKGLIQNDATLLLDGLTTKYNEDYQAQQIENQAALDEYEADQVRSTASRYFLGGIAGGAAAGISSDSSFNPFSDISVSYG